jgi:glucose-6-phosphate 1-dehydrogenase
MICRAPRALSPQSRDEPKPMSPAASLQPCDFVVFGGTGDLAGRKLLPALYLRDRDGQLPVGTRILAASRAGRGDQGYRAKIRGELSRFVPATEHDDAAAALSRAPGAHLPAASFVNPRTPLCEALTAEAGRLVATLTALGDTYTPWARS